MTFGTTGSERAFVWAIAIGLTVWVTLPEAIARFTPEGYTVVFALAVLGAIAAAGYGYAHGGVAGSVLLAVAPLIGAVGSVSIVGAVAPLVPTAAPAEGQLAWELSIALVIGIVVGGIGTALGRGVRRVHPAERRQSNPGTADR
ncbi:hypothetical protein AArcSl_2589 [Halalkaliarchaeum desulfuricum]|uniref:Uncharacterized protein n=1 Tax=Halalkaliarchaeum desulfuricum TaxID=2055893 RepID=A0A343TM86_9EURY|nr:hypothetical protein [Halalkaliarchaeum desulfuricum]AUX10208.1 hypothetical protein AArcSl_2589 [Halalkaliarchaeum desulfuricum]